MVAFDSKEFRREKFENGVRQTSFYTPLGVGVKIDDSEGLHDAYRKICKDKGISHAVFEDCNVFSSNYLSRKYGTERTTDFLYSLIFGISDFIKKVFFNYVILSPKSNPEINVGGHFSPTIKIPTLKFLTMLNPMFSYLTAWNYVRRYGSEDEPIYIDAFSSKNTMAWLELKNHDPLIYPHGDECNLPISIADLFAYVTDRKLSKLRLKLSDKGINEVWKLFDFEIEIRRLTQRQLEMYRWFNYDEVNWIEYQARPILFLDLDAINMKTMVDLNPYQHAANYIYKKGGSIQGYDRHIDSKRVQNGDVYVYAGGEPQRRATTFSHIYDIETYSVRELLTKSTE